MKKVLLLLFLAVLLPSCEKDEELFTEIFAQFKRSDMPNNQIGEYVFYRYKLSFGVIREDYGSTDIFPLYTSENKCPNKNKTHTETDYLKMYLNEQFKGYRVCSNVSCKAKFDGITGKAANDEAKGFTLKIYKITYDKESEVYTIWK